MISVLEVKIQKKGVNLECAVVQFSAIFGRESFENAALLFPNNCEVSIHKIFLLTYLGCG